VSADALLPVPLSCRDAERELAPGLELVRITSRATHPLRSDVLRPGHAGPCSFTGDDRPESAHLGVRSGSQLVCVGSVVPEARADGPAGGYRVRGMATAASARGRGCGRAVLAGLVAWAEAQDASEVWCNARIRAVTLYERAGFVTIGEAFEMPEIGLHRRMIRSVELAALEVGHR